MTQPAQYNSLNEIIQLRSFVVIVYSLLSPAQNRFLTTCYLSYIWFTGRFDLH